MEDMGYIDSRATDIFLGIFATATSLAFIIHWVLVLRSMHNTRSTNGFELFTLMAMKMSFLFWNMYSVNMRGGFQQYCLALSSGVGLIFACAYELLIIGFYTTIINKCIMALILCVELVLVVVLQSQDDVNAILNGPERNELLGPAAVICGIIMYSAPVILIIQAYHRKRVEDLPFRTCVFLWLNAVGWFVYAQRPATFDYYLVIANRPGVFYGAFQLLVCYILKLGKQVLKEEDASKPLLEDF